MTNMRNEELTLVPKKDHCQFQGHTCLVNKN